MTLCPRCKEGLADSGKCSNCNAPLEPTVYLGLALAVAIFFLAPGCGTCPKAGCAAVSR